jgi:hypothetical protein
MNMQVSEEFGQYFAACRSSTPQGSSAATPLRMDWNDVVSAEQVDFILGNPPFVGKKEQSASQKADMSLIFSKVNSAEVLDYVTAWYLKAVQYLRGNDKAAGLLDGCSAKPKVGRPREDRLCLDQLHHAGRAGRRTLVRAAAPWRKNSFAHRTFSWSNEARGNAAVHCVIIGFGLHDTTRKTSSSTRARTESLTPLRQQILTHTSSMQPTYL